MTENKELFSDLEENNLQMHIEMGDDGKYNTTDIGTVTFQRESGSPLTLKDVMYVLVLYADDLIPTGDEKLIKSYKADLAREFETNDLGLMHYFLGMEVWQGDEELFFSQGKYANEKLRKFHMERNKPMETPLASNWRKEDVTLGEVVEATIYRQIVGSLMYMVSTRSDMCFAIN
eukprot:PITA_20847